MCTSRTKMCNKMYKPVCGFFTKNINCFRAPCAQTFSNACMACANEDVGYTKPGDCSNYDNL